MKKSMKIAIGVIMGCMVINGCISNNTPKENKPVVQQEQTQKSPARDKFEQIPMRATYDQVKQILNVEGQPVASNTIGNITTESYNFMVNGKRLYLTFQNGELSHKQCFEVMYCASKITLEQYNKIQQGMTYDQVKQIFGCDGELFSQTQFSHGYASKGMVWLNKNGEDARIGFDANGYVNHKMQRGLH